MYGFADVHRPAPMRRSAPRPARPTDATPGRLRAGFVLMEAVVALAVLSIFGIAVLAALAAQIRTADQANRLLEARFLAEDRLTALRMLDFQRLEKLPDSLAAGAFPPPFDGFTWTASSEAVPDEFDLFAVDVVVSGHGVAYPLRTLIYRPSPESVVQAVP